MKTVFCPQMAGCAALLASALLVGGCTGSGVDALNSAAAPQPLAPPPAQALAVEAVPQPGDAPVVPLPQAPATAATAPSPAPAFAEPTVETVSAPSAYPSLGSVPVGAASQLTPAEEIDMLTRLNAELGSRATLSPSEAAAFEQRRLRLLQLARTNAASVQSAIEAR